MLEDIQKDIQPYNSSGGAKFLKGGFFRRAVAFIIDHLLLLSLTYIVLKGSIIFLFLQMFSSAVKFGIIITIIILFFEIYFIIFEWAWNGKTPGKWFAGLKVVRSNGDKLDFNCSLVRNFLRCIYFIPPVFVIPDLISMIISTEQKRIGDIFAGTIVIRTKQIPGNRGQTLDSNEPLSSAKDVIN